MGRRGILSRKHSPARRPLGETSHGPVRGWSLRPRVGVRAVTLLHRVRPRQGRPIPAPARAAPHQTTHGGEIRQWPSTIPIHGRSRLSLGTSSTGAYPTRLKSGQILAGRATMRKKKTPRWKPSKDKGLGIPHSIGIAIGITLGISLDDD